MSKHILTADGHLYHCDTADELYHYGVPGMKWGVRKKLDLVSNRQAKRTARTAMREARYKAVADGSGDGIGGYRRVKRAGNKAYRQSLAATKAHNASERAKGWDRMASMAEAKGKLKKADKYGRKASKERSRVRSYETKVKMSKKTTDTILASGKALKDISKKASSKGQAAVDRYIKNHS